MTMMTVYVQVNQRQRLQIVPMLDLVPRRQINVLHLEENRTKMNENAIEY